MKRVTRVGAVVLCVSVWAAASAGPASAQTSSAAPQSVGGSATKTLDLHASILEGYDNNGPAGTIGYDPLQFNGFSSTLDAAMNYSWRTKNTELGAKATSTFRHFAQSGQVMNLGQSAGIGLSVELPAQFTLLANQSVAYSPAFFSGLFPDGTPIEPGDAGTTATDYAISNLQSYVYTSTLSLGRAFTRRSSLTLSGGYTYTDRIGDSQQWADAQSESASAEYSYKVSRNASLHGQYSYRTGQLGYVGQLDTTDHTLQMGFSYTRPLSATRRATVHVNVGASAADVPAVLLGETTLGRQYRAIGDGGVEYQFNRTWQVRGYYSRGVEYIMDLPEPVLNAGMTGAIDGSLTRHMSVSFSAGYANGESLLQQNHLPFDTYTGTAGVRYALSRSIELHSELLYYYYLFSGTAQLPTGFARAMERSAIRGGFRLSVPALRR